MKLRFEFSDAEGRLIERFDETPEAAMERIKSFLELHGSESSGCVTFFPVDAEQDDKPEKCGMCGQPVDNDCFGNPRCPTCDPPCPGCYDGG